MDGEDHRLYLAEPGWHVAIKHDTEPLNCHLADSVDGFYHRILAGELYLAKETERLCLNCALKKGILNHERPTLAHSRRS